MHRGSAAGAVGAATVAGTGTVMGAATVAGGAIAVGDPAVVGAGTVVGAAASHSFQAEKWRTDKCGVVRGRCDKWIKGLRSQGMTTYRRYFRKSQ